MNNEGNILLPQLLFLERIVHETNDDLIESLKDSEHLKTDKIIEAMKSLKREYFVTEELLEQAYIDEPLRFSKMGFNISAPHMHVFCLEYLDIQPGCSVLDIGCGSGYLTAAASYLTGDSGKVIGIDLHDHIIEFCQENLDRASEATSIKFDNVELIKQNCFLPFTEDLKFDRIHVGACCPESYLEKLTELLNVGGIIVTPYADRMMKGVKKEDGELDTEILLRVRYSDLTLPSESEMKDAKIKVEKYRASRVMIPESTYDSDIKSLVGNDIGADVIFDCTDGEKIYAHKAILAVRSPIFKAMFTSGMKESRNKLQTIAVDSTGPLMKEFLKYIYTDQYDINETNCIGLLELSSYFKVDRLICLCEKIIRDIITPDDAAVVLSIAEKFAASQLKSFVVEYIIENFEEVMSSESYKNLDRDLVSSIILKLRNRTG